MPTPMAQGGAVPAEEAAQEISTPVWKTDRSRYQAGMNCPRKRFWGYHYTGERGDHSASGGPGLEPVKRFAPLATGSAIHEGLAALLAGKGLGEALKATEASYKKELEGRALDLQEGEDGAWVIQEQKMLALALVRAYEKAALPALLGEYEVLEVEKEESWQAAPWLTFMARLDALLYQKATGDFIVQSFKSAAMWTGQQDSQNRHDFQGISEGMACEERLTRRWEELDEALAQDIAHGVLNSSSSDEPKTRLDAILNELPDPPRVMGIRMEFLLKGRRTEWPDGSGRWISPSPLIYGYRMKNPVGAQRYAWRQNWTDADGKGHRLDYRTWERFPVWEEIALGPTPEERVARWIEMLSEGLQADEGAGDALALQFVLPEVYFRDSRQSQSWKEQMMAEEARIAGRPFTTSDPTDLPLLMDMYWPMNRSRCDDYGRPCEFASLCHGGEDRMRDPIATGDFQWRVPNHPQEDEK